MIELPDAIKNLYNYIFYMLYAFLQTTPNWNNVFKGAIVYYMMDGFLLYITFYFLLRVIGVRALEGNIFIALELVVGFLVFYLNTRYFKKSDNYLEIEKNFKDESEKQR